MARPSIIPPNINGLVYSCVQEVRFLAQKCQFSMYYRAGGPINKANVPADFNAIQSNWFANVRAPLRATLSVGTTVADFRVWCMTFPSVATGIFSMGNVPGTVAGDPLPPQIAGVLTKQTLLRGKSGRGRMYICGMSEDSSTNGEPTVAWVALANALCNVLKAPFIDGGTGFTYTPVVVSLIGYAKQATLPPVPPATVGLPAPEPITGYGGMDISNMLADDIWYTQRRRTFGKGQ